MHIFAEITGIKYTPFLCRSLNNYNISELERALNNDATFILDFQRNTQVALSWWVSPKRTRSYPYARVYDSLAFIGKKATVIPIMKDEGKEGDRDFLQWDTISLMSLLGIYVIISYYKYAEKSSRYKNKITNQKFDLKQIEKKLSELLVYQSDALHWNLDQINELVYTETNALRSYKEISNNLNVKMHSEKSVKKRILKIIGNKENFMDLSRELAKKAQNRESVTNQPKEMVKGLKAKLTIKNYLGGAYFFTCDEVEIKNDYIFLIECKHSSQNSIPSLEDIKDGLLKMILFTNLQKVEIDKQQYNSIAVLKLTSNVEFNKKKLKPPQLEILSLLKKEAKINNFKIFLNKDNLNEII